MILNRRRFLISAAAPCLLRPAPFPRAKDRASSPLESEAAAESSHWRPPGTAAWWPAATWIRRKRRRFLAKLAKQQPSRPEIYKDYRRALERKDIDAVTIGTPDHWHVKIAIDAMQGGQGRLLREAADAHHGRGQADLPGVVEETRRVVQVGTQQRSEYDNRFLTAVALARSGRLGKKLTPLLPSARAEPAGRSKRPPCQRSTGTCGSARLPRCLIPRALPRRLPLVAGVLRWAR